MYSVLNWRSSLQMAMEFKWPWNSNVLLQPIPSENSANLRFLFDNTNQQAMKFRLKIYKCKSTSAAPPGGHVQLLKCKLDVGLK